MKDAHSPKAIYLKDYTPPDFLIETVNLQFDLNESETRVTATTLFTRNPNARQTSKALVLNGHSMTLISVALDNRVLPQTDYAVDTESLTVHKVPDRFTLIVVTEIKPQENTALEGLYKSSGMFCTQCEAEGFRRITYFLDRPDVMAIYTTTITANKAFYPVLLSNGNLIEEKDEADGFHRATWHDPFPKPCYLFALVAGNLLCQQDSFVTQSGRNVALKIFVEAANIDKCDHAMVSLKKSMRWDEEAYGREYDLDIFMIVAVNDFNMGAMENKGLNVFNSACVLARPDTATDGDYENIESIIGHEYFHNWSGNRVTCRDWFQLSLKEGFTVFRDQEFSSDMLSRPVKRIADVNVLRTSQFTEDAGPMAHPIRPDSFIDISNFYTVTIYNKGAEVVRMIKTLLGAESFRKGTDLYFSRHDGQAVTTDDFVKAMEDANGVELSVFKRWYSQAGTPVVRVTDAYDAKLQQYTLTLKQTCPPTPKQETKLPFHIPIEMGLLDKAGAQISIRSAQLAAQRTTGSSVLELTQAEQKFVFEQVKEKPVPSLLRGFSAPIKLEYDYSDNDLMFLMMHDADDFNRWEAGQRLAIRVISRLVDDIKAKKPLVLDAGFVQAFRKVLTNTTLDSALVAQALSLPNETYLAEMQTVVDPVAIHDAREFASRELAGALRTELSACYDANRDNAPYQFTAQHSGKRSLKNLALSYLIRLNDESVRGTAMRQFRESDNMTDVLSALGMLAHIECDERQIALDAFYLKWQHDPIVVDKWFAIQSRSAVPSTARDVRKLVQHPAFEIKNPNKVRAVVGGFAFGNPAKFHAADGEGYSFLADKVIKLSRLNPQIAARLTNAFSQWRRFDTQRQALMKAQLKRIESAPDLPKDVYEVVTKTLGGA